MTLELVLANPLDACTPLVGNYTGKVVLAIQLMPMFTKGWNVTLTSYQDVRIKPEVMAPGALLSAYSDKGYTGRMDMCETLVLAGTSMASASATGAATLVRQYFTDGYYPTGARVRSNAFNPSASLLRAMLVAGTTNMSSFTSSGLTPYDVRHGFGFVDIGRSLPLRGGPSTWKLQVGS
ncbi:prestalk-specific protein tagB, partial [Haematococcus lacustris]